MTSDLSVDLCGIRLKNPVITSAGTCGYGRELSEFYDLGKLGAFTVKSLTLEERSGNPNPRIAECFGGVLNSIGIQSRGVRYFIEHDLPFLTHFEVPIIVSIAGINIDEYGKLARILDGESGIAAIEINISCPNLEAGGCSFGSDPEIAGHIVRSVKANTRLPVIAKLTPNVTDIALIARVVERNGADAVSLNTLLGMAIDITTHKPKLGNTVGGFSGPAVKPVSIKMIWDMYKAVKIPIIGLGGITSWEDAIEFVLAGSTAISVGTALFTNPWVVFEIIEGMSRYLETQHVNSLSELRGQVRASK
jgi:dihydroorotate dehydrogenase (NAD+) catalytic subunit